MKFSKLDEHTVDCFADVLFILGLTGQDMCWFILGSTANYRCDTNELISYTDSSIV
jgi:hypothetical protein